MVIIWLPIIIPYTIIRKKLKEEEKEEDETKNLEKCKELKEKPIFPRLIPVEDSLSIWIIKSGSGYSQESSSIFAFES